MLSILASSYISYLSSRTTHLLLDKGMRIIGVLAGRPKGEDWQVACNMAFCALDKVAQRIKPNKKDIESRRGIYPSIAYGMSLGNGSTVSTTLTLYPVLAY
jgi:hypothetical protein